MNNLIEDEIVEIVEIEEGDTIDITVEDAHMFFANDIYTHNSGFGAELVDTGQMGGNIKRAQKTHFLMSVAKTQEQKNIGQANIAILKARFAQDGHVFKDCIFDNNTMEIALTDPVVSNTRNINLPEINEKSLDDFNEQYKARKENEEDDVFVNEETIQHLKPISVEGGKEILKNLHNGDDIGNKNKNDLTEMIKQNRNNQDVMKND